MLITFSPWGLAGIAGILQSPPLACRRACGSCWHIVLACLTALCMCCFKAASKGAGPAGVLGCFWWTCGSAYVDAGAASEGAGPGGVLGCACQTCGVACADGVMLCPTGAGLDSARSNLGQVDTGAASKGHSAAGRAGQSRVKQERVSQPAPDSSDAGSMELPSPAKQEADAKPEPEVGTQSLTLKTLLEFRDTSAWVASWVLHSCRVVRVMAACARRACNCELPSV